MYSGRYLFISLLGIHAAVSRDCPQECFTSSPPNETFCFFQVPHTTTYGKALETCSQKNCQLVTGETWDLLKKFIHCRKYSVQSWIGYKETFGASTSAAAMKENWQTWAKTKNLEQHFCPLDKGWFYSENCEQNRPINISTACVASGDCEPSNKCWSYDRCDINRPAYCYCEMAYCPPHGSAQWLTWVGHGYNFTCKPFHKFPNGAVTVETQCQYNRTWSNSDFGQCSGYCNNTFDQATGTLETGDYWINKNYKFTCNDGLILLGNLTSILYRCSFNNTWKPKFTQCRGFCTIESFDNISGILETGDYFVGDSYAYQCETHMQTGQGNLSQSYLCNNVRRWTPGFTECQEMRKCTATAEFGPLHIYNTECCGEAHNQYRIFSQLTTNGQDCAETFAVKYNMRNLIIGADEAAKVDMIEANRRLQYSYQRLMSARELEVLKVVKPLENSLVSVATAFAFLLSLLSFSRKHFSLSVSNSCALITLLAAQSVRDVLYVATESHSDGCKTKAILLQFLFIWSFCFQFVKATELLAIFGNVLTNRDFVHPYLLCSISLLLPIALCTATLLTDSYGVRDFRLVSKLSCLINLQSSNGIITVVTATVILWLALVILESRSCVRFKQLRIRRQETKSENIILTSLFYWSHAEIILNLMSYLLGAIALHTQIFVLFLLSANISTALGVICVLSQSASLVRIVKWLRKAKNTTCKNLGNK